MPVFVLILARRTCLLSFSSMQYRLRFFAIFLSMIVANSKNGVIFVIKNDAEFHMSAFLTCRLRNLQRRFSFYNSHCVKDFSSCHFAFALNFLTLIVYSIYTEIEGVINTSFYSIKSSIR